jgi:putative tricarboxylic transport membrane protein
MRGLEKIACLIWLGVGGFFSVGSIKYGVGSLSEPGPGFFPLFAGLLLSLAAIGHLAQLILKPSISTSGGTLWAEARWGRGVAVVAGLILYAFTVDFLGYVIATFLLMLVFFSLYDWKRWKVALIGSLAVISVTYIVFSVWLKVQFPAGLLRGLGV